MYYSWFGRDGNVGAYLRGWWYRWRLGSQAFQAGPSQVQGEVFPYPDASGGLKYTKLVLTAASLVAVFAGWFLGKDPSQLQIIIPSLVGAYCAANVWADLNNRKYNDGTGNSIGGGDNGGK